MPSCGREGGKLFTGSRCGFVFGFTVENVDPPFFLDLGVLRARSLLGRRETVERERERVLYLAGSFSLGFSNLSVGWWPLQ